MQKDVLVETFVGEESANLIKTQTDREVGKKINKNKLRNISQREA